MLEITESELESRCGIGKIEGVPVRFFVITSDCESGDIIEAEVTESEFLEFEGDISYERHTVFANGVSQICLTKSAY